MLKKFTIESFLTFLIVFSFVPRTVAATVSTDSLTAAVSQERAESMEAALNAASTTSLQAGAKILPAEKTSALRAKSMSVTMDKNGKVTVTQAAPSTSVPNADVSAAQEAPTMMRDELVTTDQNALNEMDNPEINSQILKEKNEKPARANAWTRFTENFKDRNRAKNIEIALQYAKYHYETAPSWPAGYFYDVANSVENKGSLIGFSGAYTFHSSRQIHSLKDMTSNVLPTFARIEGDISRGKIDYSSYATGTGEGCNAWEYNLRALAGYDFPNADNSFILTPYIGIGYRRFTNDAGGWEPWLAQNYIPFDKISNYYYLPIGLETLKHVNEKWDIGFKLEGDPIMSGSYRYNFHDSGVYDRYAYGTNELVHIQLENSTSALRGGIGFRTSFKIVRKFSLVNLFVEPTFEYWHLAKSKEEQEHARGTDGRAWVSVNASDGSPWTPVWEPSNTTLKTGVRMGLQF